MLCYSGHCQVPDGLQLEALGPGLAGLRYDSRTDSGVYVRFAKPAHTSLRVVARPTVFIFYFILFLYIQFIVLRCISMLHVRSDVWIRSVPLRVQLLSYSCWDSGCSRFRPWFGVRLGGILSTTTRGRAIIAINVCFHPLTARLYHRICV